MKVNTENLNPAMEFNLPDGGSVEVRTLTLGQIQAIRKQTRTRKPNRQGVMIEHINNELEADLTWAECIVSWKGIIDKDDKPIKCTPENKKLLMNGCPEFASVVVDMLDKIEQALEANAETVSKN